MSEVIDLNQWKEESNRLERQDLLKELEDKILDALHSDGSDDDSNDDEDSFTSLINELVMKMGGKGLLYDHKRMSELAFSGFSLHYMDPSNVLGLIGRAFDRINSCDRQEAVEYLDKALNIDRQNREVVFSYLYLADNFKYSRPNFPTEQVFGVVDTALEKFPGDAEILVHALNNSLHLGNFDDHERAYACYKKLKVLGIEFTEEFRDFIIRKKMSNHRMYLK